MILRQEIIKRINSIENPTILNEILNLIKVESEIEEAYVFSREEREAVLQGVQDIDAGNYYGQKEATTKVKKWLEEQSNGLKNQ